MKELEFDFLAVGQWQDKLGNMNFNLYGLESKTGHVFKMSEQSGGWEPMDMLPVPPRPKRGWNPRKEGK